MTSRYDTMECRELVTLHQSAKSRVAELAALREKSGSQIANAIAYDSEYTQARAMLSGIDDAAGRKNCDLTPPKPVEPVQEPPKAKNPRGRQ